MIETRILFSPDKPATDPTNVAISGTFIVDDKDEDRCRRCPNFTLVGGMALDGATYMAEPGFTVNIRGTCDEEERQRHTGCGIGAFLVDKNPQQIPMVPGPQSPLPAA